MPRTAGSTGPAAPLPATRGFEARPALAAGGNRARAAFETVTGSGVTLSATMTGGSRGRRSGALDAARLGLGRTPDVEG